MSGFYLGLTLGVQLFVIWRWRGIWRWLAIAPLLAVVGYVPLAMILVTFDPAFATKWMVILQVLFLLNGSFVLLLWVTRGLIRLATEF